MSETTEAGGRRLQMTVMVLVAAIIIVITGFLLSIMETTQIQYATTITALTFLVLIALYIYLL